MPRPTKHPPLPLGPSQSCKFPRSRGPVCSSPESPPSAPSWDPVPPPVFFLINARILSGKASLASWSEHKILHPEGWDSARLEQIPSRSQPRFLHPRRRGSSPSCPTILYNGCKIGNSCRCHRHFEILTSTSSVEEDAPRPTELGAAVDQLLGTWPQDRSSGARCPLGHYYSQVSKKQTPTSSC